jgi:hypothetical protein
LLDAAIERIERSNPKLNAVVYKAYDEARAIAAGALPDGPFKGVPFLIKDSGRAREELAAHLASRFAQIDADSEDSELTKRYRASGRCAGGQNQHAGVRHSWASPVQRCWGHAAILGIPSTSPVAHLAGRQARLRPAWSRWRMRAMAWVRSASPPRAVGLSA